MSRVAMASLLAEEEEEGFLDRDAYVMHRRQISRYDHALGLVGKIIVTGEAGIWIAWLVGIFVVLLHPVPHPVAPIPGLPPQVYNTLASIDRAHWRIGAHIALLLAFFSLMWGRGGEISYALFFVPLFILCTDMYSIMEITLHIYHDQHPSFRAYELTLACTAIVFTISTIVWYALVYVRYTRDGIRFDGLPSELQIFKRRLRHVLNQLKSE